jgi:aerobic-type carbon monoxide dehydrogenase small subunit (CoxS/CutS family)
MKKRQIQFSVNGTSHKLETDDKRPLLAVLRTDLELTGTKYGCGAGHCGTCTVLVNGNAKRSCSLTLADVEGKEITTIEEFSADGTLHPLQQAFAEEGAQQCGFCTPGMIMNAAGLLARKPNANREEIIKGMDGNLCRCGAHVRILRAIEKVAGSKEAVQ